MSGYNLAGLFAAAGAFMLQTCNFQFTNNNAVWGDIAGSTRAYIMAASYGPLDVTNTVKDMYLNKAIFSIQASNSIFGEPWGSNLKTLQIILHYGGSYHTLFCIEDKYIQLPMYNQNTPLAFFPDPIGSIGAGVVGAAFGPQDSTAQVQQIAAGLALGQTQVTADRTNFGESLPGWFKSMLVVYKRNGQYYTSIATEGNQITIK